MSVLVNQAAAVKHLDTSRLQIKLLFGRAHLQKQSDRGRFLTGQPQMFLLEAQRQKPNSLRRIGGQISCSVLLL